MGSLSKWLRIMCELDSHSELTDLLSAGNAALLAADWDGAWRSYQQAVAISATPEALEGLGMAAWWTDDAAVLFESRERAYKLYRDADDKLGAARIATWLALDNYIFRHAPAIANGWFQRARRILDEVDGPTFEHCFFEFCKGHVALEEYDNQSTMEHAERALSLARELGIVDFEMLALALRGLALVSEGRVVEGMNQLDESVTAVLAGEVTDPDAIVTSCCYLFYACERVRDYDRAHQWCDTIRGLCERWSYRSMVSVCRTHYASVLVWRGDWSLAETELTEATSELAAGRAGWAAEGMLRLADLRRRQGRLREAADLYARAAYHPISLLGRAEIALNEGDGTQAKDLVERFFRRVPRSELTQHFNGLDILVRAELSKGDVRAAEHVLGEVEEIAAAVGTVPLTAAARMAHGLVARARGDLSAARRALEDAVDLYVRSGSPYESARARGELSQVLRAEGQIALADAEARAALTTFSEIGAMLDVRRLTESLREHASTMQTQLASGGRYPGFSRRESEVLNLIAQGYSNPEIAERLFLSVRTVERHISAVYRKVGAEGRSARAVATAFALGIRSPEPASK